MVVLGIDPSYTCTGLVVLDKTCALVRSAKVRLTPGPGRLFRAGDALSQIVAGLDVTLAVIEDAAYGAPSRITVGKLKELTGAYKYVLEHQGIPYLDISPSKAKLFIAGKGTAEKYVVAEELARIYGIRFPNDRGFDLSDAAALAVWGVKHGR